MAAQIGVEQLRDLLARGEMPVILDVREPDETRLARFAGAMEIPMGQVPRRLDELSRDDRIVVLCHHGVRGGRVAAYLDQEGFRRVANLSGGIDAWSMLIDPKVPRY